MRWANLSLAMLVLLLGTTLARADGLIVVENPPPGISIDAPHRFAPLEVKYHHVTVTIEGQVATTQIEQVFHNPSGSRLEGQYLFPLPDGASIDRFAMEVDGKMTEAELLDAAKARKIYEDIVRSMRDPALMEYAGRGLFKVRIFPIEPHSDKQVELTYTQVLEADAGLVGYRYPLNTERFSAAPIETVSLKVELDAEQPITTVYSPSHDVEVTRHGPRRAVVGFEARDVRPDTDFQLFYSLEAREGIDLSMLTFRDTAAPGEAGYFMLLAAPGAAGQKDQRVAKDVVFVADTSGSMAGDKIKQLQEALKFCLASLDGEDRFQLIRFSTEAEPLFDTPVRATEAHRDEARRFVEGFRATGGTAIADALTRATAPLRDDDERGTDRPYYVIFLTDGQPTIGERSIEGILEAAVGEGDSKSLAERVRAFSFGIGTAVNTHLLDRLAESTGATTEYVLPEEDIEVKVSSFYEKISHPVLANLELDAAGDVRLSRLHPRPLPDLFRGEQLIVLGRYTGHGETALTLTGTVNGEEQKIVHDARFPQAEKSGEASDHDFIPRLWATRRVGHLLEQIRLHGEDEELREETTKLARRYGIITPYTSYLIVEDERQDLADARRAGRPARQPMFAPSSLRLGEAEQMQRRARLRMRQQSGQQAVDVAQESQSLKQAARARSDLDPGFIAGNRVAPSAPGRAGQGQPVLSDVEARRFVAGKTFYLRDRQWIDADVADIDSDAEPVEIRFGSDEYFKLLEDQPKASRWLALGQQVTVAIDGKVYRIVDGEE